MINKPNYHKATNSAYELLIKQDYIEIPVNLSKLLQINRQNIRLITYSQMAARFNITVSNYLSIVPSEFGFTIKKDYWNYIIYNEEKGYYTNRFTISHEVGHIIMGHTIDDSVAEREANCFARNLLCPIPFIDTLNITCINDYMGWFHISDLMAENCIKNVGSDRYYIDGQLYGLTDNLIYTYISGESLSDVYAYSRYS